MLKVLTTTHDKRTALVVGLTRAETESMLAGEEGTALILDLDLTERGPIEAVVLVAGEDEDAIREDMEKWGLLG